MAVKSKHLVVMSVLCAITTQVTNNFARYSSVPNRKELVINQTKEKIITTGEKI